MRILDESIDAGIDAGPEPGQEANKPPEHFVVSGFSIAAPMPGDCGVQPASASAAIIVPASPLATRPACAVILSIRVITMVPFHALLSATLLQLARGVQKD